MAGISHKHKLFAQAFFHCHNASQAARDAGYSQKCAATTGARLVQRADVKDYLVNLSEKDMGRQLSTIMEAKDICWKHIRANGHSAAVWMGHLIKMEGWGMETSRIELKSLPAPTFVLPQHVEVQALEAGGGDALPITPTSSHVDEMTPIIDVEAVESS